MHLERPPAALRSAVGRKLHSPECVKEQKNTIGLGSSMDAVALVPSTPSRRRACHLRPLRSLRSFVSAPTDASFFVFCSVTGGSSNHAVVDVDTVAPRLLSPTPVRRPPTVFAARGALSSPLGPRRPAGESTIKHPLRSRRHMPSSSRGREQRLQRGLTSFLEALPTRMNTAAVPLSVGLRMSWSSWIGDRKLHGIFHLWSLPYLTN